MNLGDIANAIANGLWNPTRKQAPGEGGMAGNAQNAMQMRKEYIDYATQTQEAGQQPLPYDQWVKQRFAQPTNGAPAPGTPQR